MLFSLPYSNLVIEESPSGIGISLAKTANFFRTVDLLSKHSNQSGIQLKISLGIEYYPHCVGDYHGEEKQGQVLESFQGILKKFTNLETAEIPITVLLGFGPSEADDLGIVLPNTLCKPVMRNDLANVYEYEWETPEFLNCVHDFVTQSDWRSITSLLQHIYLRLLPLEL